MSGLPPADLERLSAYLDGELPPDERTDLERRLAEDAALRAELEALRRVVALVRETPVLRAPRDFRLDPAVYGRRSVRRMARFYRRAGALSTLAAVALLVIGVLVVLRTEPPRVLIETAAEAPAAVVEEARPTHVAAAPTLLPTAMPPAGSGASDQIAPTPTLVPPAAPESADIAAESEGAAAAAQEIDQAAQPEAPIAEAMREPTGEALAGPEVGAAGAPPPTITTFSGGGNVSPGQPPRAPAPTMTAAIAMLPTATATVTASPTTAASPTLTPTPQIERQASETSPFLPDPGIFFGGSLALLALAAMFFALSRRGQP